jgi:hypothetical protein
MIDTLYKRLDGYDSIAAVSDDLLIRLQADPQLAPFFGSTGARIAYSAKSKR